MAALGEASCDRFLTPQDVMARYAAETGTAPEAAELYFEGEALSLSAAAPPPPTLNVMRGTGRHTKGAWRTGQRNT